MPHSVVKPGRSTNGRNHGRQVMITDSLERQFTAGSILVSGATGFVGRALLATLRKRHDRQIICLVRAPDDAVARERGRAVTVDPRVLWLRADLEQEQLGLDPGTWRALGKAIHEIFHCAASVKFNLPLEQAQRINVDGTRRLLDLAQAGCRQGTFRRFHHISTAFVAGRRKGAVEADFLPDDRATNFRNSYERTKARAERMLRQQTQVDVSIYRPSIVAGHSTTGKTDNWNVLYAPMRLISRGRLPVVPKSGAGLVDCVGVDYVAEGIVELASRAQRGLNSYHLTMGRRALTVEEFAAGCVLGCREYDSSYRGQCSVIGPLRWAAVKAGIRLAARAPRLAPRVRCWGKLGQRSLRCLEPYEPYAEVGTAFVNDFESGVLAAAGIAMPNSLQYLSRIVRYALRVSFDLPARGGADDQRAKRTAPVDRRRSSAQRLGRAVTELIPAPAPVPW